MENLGYIVLIVIAVAFVSGPFLIGRDTTQSPSEPTPEPAKTQRPPRTPPIVPSNGALQRAQAQATELDEIIRSLISANSAVEADRIAISRITKSLESKRSLEELKLMHSRSHVLGTKYHLKYKQARQSKTFLSQQIRQLEASSKTETSSAMRDAYRRLMSTATAADAELQQCIDRHLTLRKQHNDATHDLKIYIRDNCGPEGRAWYEKKRNK